MNKKQQEIFFKNLEQTESEKELARKKANEVRLKLEKLGLLKRYVDKLK